MLNRYDGTLQGNLQNFIHGFDKMYREACEDLLRDIRQVLLIVLRKYHDTQAHSVGGQQFFFHAPVGRNLPRRVISPVMGTSRRTGFLVSALTSEVQMVMPAEGPSLGIAPSGTCTWISMLR